MRPVFLCSLAVLTFAVSGTTQAQRSPSVTPKIRKVVQGSLIAPGSTPFHLEAHIGKDKDAPSDGDVEVFWLAPDKYRRVIHSKDFNQTLIVNGSDVFEENSSDYFPLTLRTLVTAMLDPKPILDAVQPGDRLSTKATGDIDESGRFCFNAKKTICAMAPGGLRESIEASGHSVEFSYYETFRGKRIARTLTNAPRLGEERTVLNVTLLEELKSPEPSLFEVKEKTPPEKQLHFSVLSNEDLLRQRISPEEIIWPQPLDGEEHGPASFYISFDTTGKVREVHPLYTVNERTNESAVHQLRRWNFKPVLQNGLPAQGEGILNLTVDTRAFGPKEPLTSEEARAHANNVVEPDLPKGTYPPGTVYTLAAAIDADGYLIEVIAGSGPNELFMPCYDTIRRWNFKPIIKNGKPRPYRAIISFKTP